MSKHIKSIIWCIFMITVYVVLQLITTKVMGKGIFHYKPDYSDTKTWGVALFVRQVNTNLIKIIPIVVSMLIYYILYKFILKESIITKFGFSKAGTKNILIGVLIGIFASLLALLVLNNQVWNGLIYNKDVRSQLGFMVSYDMLIIIRNTILFSIISIITMAAVIPLFEEVLFRGLIINKLKTTMPIWVAIVVQALLFGILQVNMISGVYAFIVGILLGIIYMITKSTWVPVVIHSIINIFVMGVKEFGLFLIPLTTFNATKDIDTFVYHSLKGGTQDAGPLGGPLVLNIILGLTISIVIVILVIWLRKSNRRQTNLE